ncbi:MAG: hypothetical protein QOK49_3213, partial [Baekduia sp.]|nr:hypothetical protein [Baekduia sp.]
LVGLGTLAFFALLAAALLLLLAA